MRAIDHACETLGSLNSTAEADSWASEALSALVPSLLKCKQGGDITDFSKCQYGSWKAILPVTYSGIMLGASHAVGHKLGGLFDVPHGYTSCVMLAPTLAFNKKVNAQRQAKIIEAFKGLGIGEFDDAAGYVDAYVRALGLPRTFGDVGVHEDQLGQLAEACPNDFWSPNNPIPMKTPEQFLELFEIVKSYKSSAQV